MHSFPPHLICVTQLPCETQMFQIVTQRCKTLKIADNSAF